MWMLQGPKNRRSLRGKVLDPDSPQSQSHPRQQARTRRSCRPRPTAPKGGRREAPRPPPGPGPATAMRPHISPAAPTNNGPIAGRSQPSHDRRGPGLVFRALRRPVWRLVRGSEGAGQGATHGRGRSKNQARPPPDRSTATRRAAWQSGRRWLPRPYGFDRRSTRR